jgi:hypothetical protein
MQLIVDRRGTVHTIYGEAIDLAALGELTIRRASRVEPDGQGAWWADLAPVRGPHLGPFARRSEALEAERLWLEKHWLAPTTETPEKPQ